MSTWAEMVVAAQSRGWTLKELAVELGIAYSTLCDIRRGETKEPTGMAAVRLHRIHVTEAKPIQTKAA